MYKYPPLALFHISFFTTTILRSKILQNNDDSDVWLAVLERNTTKVHMFWQLGCELLSLLKAAAKHVMEGRRHCLRDSCSSPEFWLVENSVQKVTRRISCLWTCLLGFTLSIRTDISPDHGFVGSVALPKICVISKSWTPYLMK
jgi:hypothetical protein